MYGNFDKGISFRHVDRKTKVNPYIFVKKKYRTELGKKL